MKSRESASQNGCGVLSVLLIVFVVLKLIGTITWPWWLVLTPLWVSIGILIILLIVALIATR